MLAQKAEQRQQRQSENGEVVALDLAEELSPQAFELVDTDRGSFSALPTGTDPKDPQ